MMNQLPKQRKLLLFRYKFQSAVFSFKINLKLRAHTTVVVFTITFRHHSRSSHRGSVQSERAMLYSFYLFCHLRTRIASDNAKFQVLFCVCTETKWLLTTSPMSQSPSFFSWLRKLSRPADCFQLQGKQYFDAGLCVDVNMSWDSARRKKLIMRLDHALWWCAERATQDYGPMFVEFFDLDKERQEWVALVL